MGTNIWFDEVWNVICDRDERFRSGNCCMASTQPAF